MMRTGRGAGHLVLLLCCLQSVSLNATPWLQQEVSIPHQQPPQRRHQQQQQQGEEGGIVEEATRFRALAHVGKLLVVKLKMLFPPGPPDVLPCSSQLQDLPSWLLYNKAKNELLGLPLREHLGRSFFTLTCFCQPPEGMSCRPVSIIFLVSVQPMDYFIDDMFITSSSKTTASHQSSHPDSVLEEMSLVTFSQSAEMLSSVDELNENLSLNSHQRHQKNFSPRKPHLEPSLTITESDSDHFKQIPVPVNHYLNTNPESLQEQQEPCAFHYVASLVLCSPPDKLNATHRVQVLQRAAEFLSIPCSTLTWLPFEDGKLHLLDKGFSVEFGGASERSLCSENINSELFWPLSCSTSHHVAEFVKIFEHNVHVKRIEREVGIEVIGWYVATKEPKLGHRRRRRRASNRTPVPTPVMYPSSATAMSSQPLHAGVELTAFNTKFPTSHTLRVEPSSVWAAQFILTSASVYPEQTLTQLTTSIVLPTAASKFTSTLLSTYDHQSGPFTLQPSLDGMTVQPSMKEFSTQISLDNFGIQPSEFSLQTPADEFSLQTSVDEFSLQTSVDEFSVRTPADEFSLQTSVDEFSLQTSVDGFSLQTSLDELDLQTSVDGFILQTPMHEFSPETSVHEISLQTSVDEFSLHSSVGDTVVQSETLNEFSVHSSLSVFSIQTSVDVTSAQTFVDVFSIPLSFIEVSDQTSVDIFNAPMSTDDFSIQSSAFEVSDQLLIDEFSIQSSVIEVSDQLLMDEFSIQSSVDMFSAQTSTLSAVSQKINLSQTTSIFDHWPVLSTDQGVNSLSDISVIHFEASLNASHRNVFDEIQSTKTFNRFAESVPTRLPEWYSSPYSVPVLLPSQTLSQIDSKLSSELRSLATSSFSTGTVIAESFSETALQPEIYSSSQVSDSFLPFHHSFGGAVASTDLRTGVSSSYFTTGVVSTYLATDVVERFISPQTESVDMASVSSFTLLTSLKPSMSVDFSVVSSADSISPALPDVSITQRPTAESSQQAATFSQTPAPSVGFDSTIVYHIIPTLHTEVYFTSQPTVISDYILVTPAESLAFYTHQTSSPGISSLPSHLYPILYTPVYQSESRLADSRYFVSLTLGDMTSTASFDEQVTLVTSRVSDIEPVSSTSGFESRAFAISSTSVVNPTTVSFISELSMAEATLTPGTVFASTTSYVIPATIATSSSTPTTADMLTDTAVVSFSSATLSSTHRMTATTDIPSFTTSTTLSMTMTRRRWTTPRRSSIWHSTTEVLSTGVSNNPPFLVNVQNYMTAMLGQYFEKQIPTDMFYDVEDGNTRALTLTLTLPNDQPLPLNFWVQFDPSRQVLFGLPLVADLDIGIHRVVIVATDTRGLGARNSITLYVNSSAFAHFTHRFIMKFGVEFGQFMQRRDNVIALMKKLGTFFGDESAQFVTIVDVSMGSLLLSWTNSSLSGPSCDNQTVHALLNQMMRRDESIRSAFTRHMGKKLRLLQVTYQPDGACLYRPPLPTTPTTTLQSEVSAKGGLDSDLLTEIILPVLIVLLLVLLLVIVILFVYRCRQQRGAMDTDKELHTIDRSPVILPNEMAHGEPYNARPKNPTILPYDQERYAGSFPRSRPRTYEHYRQSGSLSRDRPNSYTFDDELSNARPVTVIFNNFDSAPRHSKPPGYWNDNNEETTPNIRVPPPYLSTTSV